MPLRPYWRSRSSLRRQPRDWPPWRQWGSSLFVRIAIEAPRQAAAESLGLDGVESLGLDEAELLGLDEAELLGLYEKDGCHSRSSRGR